MEQSQKQVLHRDKIVLHPSGLALRVNEVLVHLAGDIDLPRFPPAATDCGKRGHQGRGLPNESFPIQTHTGEELGNQPPFLGKQRAKEMGLLNLHIPLLQGKVLGQPDGLQGFLGVLLCIHILLTSHF